MGTQQESPGSGTLKHDVRLPEGRKKQKEDDIASYFGVWIKDTVTLLLPQDTERAIRKADWLLEGIAEKRFPDGIEAAQVLESWSRARIP